LPRLQQGHEFIIERRQRIEQGRAPVGWHGMEHQIAIGISENLHPAGVKPELLRDAHSLAVTVS